MKCLSLKFIRVLFKVNVKIENVKHTYYADELKKRI